MYRKDRESTLKGDYTEGETNRKGRIQRGSIQDRVWCLQSRKKAND